MGRGAAGQSWHPRGSWVKPWASLQPGEIMAINGVPRGGSDTLQASGKLNAIQPLEDSLLLALCFKTASSSHNVFHCKHFMKLLRVIDRWGNSGPEELTCPKPPSRPSADTQQTVSRHPANATVLPPSRPGAQGCTVSRTHSTPECLRAAQHHPPPCIALGSCIATSAPDSKHIFLQRQKGLCKVRVHPVHAPLQSLASRESQTPSTNPAASSPAPPTKAEPSVLPPLSKP